MAINKVYIEKTKLDTLANAFKESFKIDRNLTIDEMTGLAGDLESAVKIVTADATATSLDILDGKTAYVNGEKITGAILNSGITNVEISTPNGATIALTGTYNANDIVVSLDAATVANTVKENIADGVTILGVVGTGFNTKNSVFENLLSTTFGSEV